MRERAEGVGGSLAIRSIPGDGTEVECRLPCLKSERLPRQSVVIR
jgi:signal transduction histidine kinase